MIIAFGVIGFLVLVLIYFVVRNQSMQAELNQLHHQLKHLEKHRRYSLGALVLLSGELQKSYKARLDSLQKHALLSSEDYNVASFIISQVEFIIMQCCEKSDTIEEALNKALVNSTYEIEEINKFIAKQDADIRVPWCKNTIGGFISACHNLTSERLKLQARAADSDTETSADS